MEILHFGLGIRFDVMEGEEEQATPRQLWEEIFSVLTTSDVRGMHVYGGRAASAEYASEDSCYICAFTNGSLKEMRRVYRKLEEDAGVGMYLSATHPFLQNNALQRVEGLTYYGKIQRDGTLSGGEEPLFGVRVCKTRGKRRPVGKGIVFLLAPDAFRGTFTSRQAIRRLTLAARKHFTGVRVLPLPIANGGPGTVDALLTACNGTGRTVQIRGPQDEKIQARYAVLRGSTAVIEMPEAFAAHNAPQGAHCSSFGIGELIRRALDEGLHDIIIGVADSCINDGGLGCLRALGVKLLDSDGAELAGFNGDMEKLIKIDTELIHPRICATRFILMTDCEDNTLVSSDHARYRKLLKESAGFDASEQIGAGAADGLGAALMAFLRAARKTSIDALLDAAEFDRRIKNVSLVVTGEGKLDAQSMHPGRAVGAIMERCARQKVPVSLIAGCMGEGSEILMEKCDCSVITAVDAPMSHTMAMEKAVALFDSAANRMFRFIRLGREIERFSTRKAKIK